MRAVFVCGAVLVAACGGTSAPEPEVAAAPAAAEAAPARGPAAGGLGSGEFLVSVQEQPVATETFRRTRGRLEADLAVPGQAEVGYEARVGADELIDSMAIDIRPMAQGAGAPQRVVLTTRPAGDSTIVTAVTSVGDSSRTSTFGSRPGVLLYINPSPSLIEQIARRARRIGGTQAQVPLFVTGGGQTIMADVSMPSADSAIVTVAGVTIRMHVDAEGRLLGGAIPVQNAEIRRAD